MVPHLGSGVAVKSLGGFVLVVVLSSVSVMVRVFKNFFIIKTSFLVLALEPALLRYAQTCNLIYTLRLVN